jgi:methylase of polypeptide subunit release factors
MLAGVTGTLISQFFAEEILFKAFAGQLGETSRSGASRALWHWWHRTQATLGPASSVRTVWDNGIVPLLRILGWEAQDPSKPTDDKLRSVIQGPAATVVIYAAPWEEDLGRVWRNVARRADIGDRWCVCANGRQIRLIDATRVYADCHLEFDLELASSDSRTFALFWAVLHARAFDRVSNRLGLAPSTLLDRCAAMSAAHATAVRGSLQRGVLEAVGEVLTSLLMPRPRSRRARPPSALTLSMAFQGSLTAVYRILFLLFAEARGLVPIWHPVYRDSYTIEALRTGIERASKPCGLWETLQAIARLAREGCLAGDLRVTPFNGRLFAPMPVIDSSRARDESIQRALLVLSTTEAQSAGRQRIDYRDLGVEQLGAVYEGVLDYEPAWTPNSSPTVRLQRTGRARKTTGTFYTPRSLTEYLVRRTLYPLIKDATPEAILCLRVLDPAMGSGAFLVAACHYLARAYEAALVNSGACRASEISDADRSTFRRQVAQRCLFGVDRNPMAVQLARLSLWLATLAADRPLTFLDHNLRVGNSVIGATPSDLARRAPPRSAVTRSRAGSWTLPFFDDAELEEDLRAILPNRVRIAREPGDTLASVREKERLLEQVSTLRGSLGRWRDVADLWCACWFWPEDDAPTPRIYAAVTDHQLHRHSALPAPIIDRLLAVARRTANREGFFHWIFEFPEAFVDADGQGLREPGFDAVIGNPPWDVLRADPGGATDRRTTGQQTRFIKDAGTYRAQSDGHVNLYQVFLERTMQLARRGGRLGIVLPSGLLTDQGSSPVRRLLLEACQTDSLAVFENRDRIFPIHRSVKFVLLTSTMGGRTTNMSCRMGERDPATLEAIGDDSYAHFPVRLGASFIERISGPDLAIPEIHNDSDVALLEGICHRYQPLAARDGWNVKFGRELNATDDARHFTGPESGIRVLEGKQIEPFRAHPDRSRHSIPEAVLAKAFQSRTSWRRARLAYREVAGASNRLTLIAAIVPAGVVTTHTVYCLKTPLRPVEQAFLCGIFNSFVANYLVRLFVTTHVNAATMRRLRVPLLGPGDVLFAEIATLAGELSKVAEAWTPRHARLQAAVARAYELTEEEFRHVLATLPLVAATEREAALRCFSDWR